MLKVPVKTPGFAKKIFPKFIWNQKRTKKELFLTFDDGPTPEITDEVLSILKSYKAKATFFCIGKNVALHPDIFNRILEEGHTIGNHTQNHLKGWKTSTKKYLQNIVEAQNTMSSHIENRAHSVAKLFRPPYGQLKIKQGKKIIKLEYDVVMWDVLSFDWDKNTSKEACLENVINFAQNGSIIVFHDSYKASKNMLYTLPKVLNYFSKKGYVFKALNVN